MRHNPALMAALMTMADTMFMDDVFPYEKPRTIFYLLYPPPPPPEKLKHPCHRCSCFKDHRGPGHPLADRFGERHCTHHKSKPVGQCRRQYHPAQWEREHMSDNEVGDTYRIDTYERLDPGEEHPRTIHVRTKVNPSGHMLIGDEVEVNYSAVAAVQTPQGVMQVPFDIPAKDLAEAFDNMHEAAQAQMEVFAKQHQAELQRANLTKGLRG